MSIKIIDQKPDVYVTESELNKYRREYTQAYMFYAGEPPTLEEYIRNQQQARAQQEGSK